MVEGQSRGFFHKVRQAVATHTQEARLRENADVWTSAREDDLGIKGDRVVLRLKHLEV